MLMKTSFLFFPLALLLGLVPLSAKESLLDNDPDVVYLEGASDKVMEFVVIKDAVVFASKKGGRRLGVYPQNTKVQLLAMTDKGYKVKGKARHSLVSGWVSPKNLASKDPKFVENLKKYYQREREIRALIRNKEVAIGMTIAEVQQSIGEPTKKESRLTKEGRSGKWEFIKAEEQKHYNYYRDPRTGMSYKQFSHTTYEETEKLTVEFEAGVVTAITSKEDRGLDRERIVVPPVIFGF